MPFILYRHLLAELLKVFLLTTAVIVVVIAFGSAIRPLAENLLGPGGVAKWILLATVPMLQFAVPFSGGFAATLVFHRFVTDNEITAMATCGLSYRRILVPVVTLGMVLLVVMTLLVNFAVPRFWEALKEVGTQDATAVFAAAVDRGESLTAGRLTLFADGIREEEVPPGVGLERRMVLVGVAAIERDPEGHPVTEFTSETATVDLYRRGRQTWMKLAMSNATVFRAAEGTVVVLPRASPDAVLLAAGFERGPKFLPLPELIELRRTIDQQTDPFKERAGVELLLAKVDGWRCLHEKALSGRVVLADEPNRREYVIEDGVVETSGLSRRGPKPITVTEYERGIASRRAVTERVDLFFDDQLAPGSPPRFDMALRDPAVTDLRSREPVKARWPQRIIGIEVRGCPGRDWSTLGNESAAAIADEVPPDAPGPSEDLARMGREEAAKLRGAVNALRNEVDSHLMQRVAQSISAPMLLVLGAILAMWRRNSLPLAIYLLSFIPAIANILMLASGQQLMRGDHVWMGMLVMWSGTLLLLVIAAIGYRELARN